VSPAGDDFIHSKKVSRTQHGPKIPGILEPLEDEPQLLGVVAWPRLPDLGARPRLQRAHLHADALVDLKAAQGVQFLPSGPQDGDVPRLCHPEQLGPLPLQPGPAGLEQEPGHAATGGPQGQETRGQAKQKLQSPRRARGRRQVVQQQAAQLLPAWPLPTPRRSGEMTRGEATRATPGRAPDGQEQCHGQCPCSVIWSAISRRGRLPAPQHG